jgi:selenocysteine-specific elongation factor
VAESGGPAPSVVIGTAGHIDHGKTTLLRALTGIDADRLPEERRRGMTIDVGYAHLSMPDGSVIDFVDVPGHDRLVGNMLVGAGEVDAAMLVVAADDGPNAQTIEHLELLDALAIRDGVAVITKTDLVTGDRVAEVSTAVRALLARTALAGAPVVAVSGVTRAGLDELRDGIAALRPALEGHDAPPAGMRLGVDRVFAVRGRGTVVTGTLRGGAVRAGDILRLQPDGLEARVREVQVRGEAVDVASGGRTALLLAGVDGEALRRGQVLTTDPGVVATSRVLVALRAPARLGARGSGVVPADRDHLRLHLGTGQVDVLVVRGPREAIDLPDGSALAILRLAGPIAAAPGDRFALRSPSPGSTAGGGVVLDAQPPRGVSRRRLTAERGAALTGAPVGSLHARVDLHGRLEVAGGSLLAPDVEAALRAEAVRLVGAHHEADPSSAGLSLAALRTDLVVAARRRVTLGREAAQVVARDAVERALADGTLARDGDRARDPDRAAGLPSDVLEAMDRLEAALSVAAPPALSEAAKAAGCPRDGVRALESAGRIVRLEDDLAWAAATYRELVTRAISMAAATPLTPAAFRDETGTSRRYVLVILEDLDRRGVLRRTDAGHVLGPKTIAKLQARAAAARGDAP